MQYRKKGFTLIELLVVIAIIALLVSILIPSLSKAKAMAQRVACATNIHTLYSSINLYAADNNGLIPPMGYGDDGLHYWDSWTRIISVFPPNQYGWQTNRGYCPVNATHDVIVTMTGIEWDGARRMGEYAMNNYVIGYPDMMGLPSGAQIPIDRIRKPGETYFMADGAFSCCWMQGAAEMDQRHLGTLNMLWFDGHIVPMTNIPVYIWAARPWFNTDVGSPLGN